MSQSSIDTSHSGCNTKAIHTYSCTSNECVRTEKVTNIVEFTAQLNYGLDPDSVSGLKMTAMH